MTQRQTTVHEWDGGADVADAAIRKGDVVLLQAGDFVPADLRLVEARGLEVDEWELTGEIMPVEKRVDGEDVYIYRGSRVTRGSGKGVVIAAGAETEYAEILKQPWQRSQHRLPALVKGKRLMLLVCLLPPVAAVLIRRPAEALVIGAAVNRWRWEAQSGHKGYSSTGSSGRCGCVRITTWEVHHVRAKTEVRQRTGTGWPSECAAAAPAGKALQVLVYTLQI